MMAQYRVYFNRRGAPKGKIWCVDKGPGTRRRYFDGVIIEAGAQTQYNGKEPDWKNPVAWMDVCGKLKVGPYKQSRYAVIN
jgi:hypothetical protein